MADTEIPVGALRLYGVVDVDEATTSPIDGVVLVKFRDLGAVVRSTDYVRTKPGDEELADYTKVIDTMYAHGPIVPAPPGTIFRDAGVIQHWLEIHYAALHEALGAVERRASPTPPYDYIRMELGA